MRSTPSGFTLLEVMLAISILAFVTVFTSQSIQKALQNRAQIQSDIDRVSSVREALKVIEQDVNRAFNHNDMNIELYNEMAKARNKKIEEAKKKVGQPPPPGGTGDSGGSTQTDPLANAEPLKLMKEERLTEFIGESDHMDFTSLSNVRVSSEDRTGEEAEIGYSLQSCRSRKDRKRSSRCLIRRLSPYIDDDVTKGGNETALLENVTRFEIRYIGPNNPTEWVTSYSSGEGADDTTRGVFPLAVEVTLETHDKEDPRSKPTLISIVAAIRNPNNKTKKEEVPPDGSQPPSQPGQPSQPGAPGA